MSDTAAIITESITHALFGTSGPPFVMFAFAIVGFLPIYLPISKRRVADAVLHFIALAAVTVEVFALSFMISPFILQNGLDALNAAFLLGCIAGTILAFALIARSYAMAPRGWSGVGDDSAQS